MHYARMHPCRFVNRAKKNRRRQKKKKKKKHQQNLVGYELNGGANKDSIKLLKAAALF